MHILRGADIAVADDGDADAACTGINDIPVGLSSILLGAGATVDSQRLHPGILKPPGGFERADMLRIPADADFDRYGTVVAQFLHHGAGNALQQR